MRLAILDDYQSVALRCADWARLPADTTVVPFADHVSDEEQLVARLADFDMVCRMRERTHFPRRVLERLPRLKLLLATGRRNESSIDLQAARELGISVCSTQTYGCPTVEITWALILSLFRRVHFESASVRVGGWQTGLGSGLEQKCLGILGLGRYGVPVARIGQGFGMKVVAWSPNLTPERAREAGVEAVSKSSLFTLSDVVTIHMPESPRSVRIVGAQDIARMRAHSFIINTSRAGLVDEDALIEALRERRIGGAGIDVFSHEPLALDHPYRHLPNVLATPHIGYVTKENYAVFFSQTVENVLNFMAGKPIRLLT